MLLDKGKRSLRGQTRKDADAYERRFADILEFCETLNTLFNLITKVGYGGLKPVVKTLGKLVV